jgi:Reverse transcriptase (RNA-dependent DNA polymerase)
MAKALLTLAQARLRRLLGVGYFPAELPPPFTTRDFGSEAPDLASIWDGSKIRKFWTAPEHYSIPRLGHVRRKLSIVNPVNQLHVSHLVAENWDQISDRLKRSRITEFRPYINLSGGGRAVTGVNFDGVSRRRIEILADYGRYVKTDVARFYPSVYTHAIPWALLGKDVVKKTMSTRQFKTSLGNLLDQAVASGQSGQTIGIPIGPDTSRVFSELIATEIEETTKEQIVDLEKRSVRYVDDMIIGLNDNETADVILSKLSSSLYEYELELNGEKTNVMGLGTPHLPEWIQFIRSFELSSRVGLQREEIDSYFEHCFYLAGVNPRENVTLFAVKRAASFVVAETNWDHFVRWLLYAARRSSDCLEFVVQYLSSLYEKGTALPLDQIAAFINRQIPRHAEAAQTSEVAWLLFWARELRMTLPASVFAQVLVLRSGANALLTLDLLQRGLIDGKIDTNAWRSCANAKGLASEMWLAAYEITKKSWWPRAVTSQFIQTHDFFSDLWNRNVEFYDPSRKARPQRARRFLRRPTEQTVFLEGAYP